MKRFKNIFIIGALICLTILGVYFFTINTAKSESSNSPLVSILEVKKSMDSNEKVPLIDVRRPDEYSAGHLKGSVLLTLDTIGEKASIVMPDKNKKYYVYCRTGHRSGQAITQLQQMGYTDVHSMEGGITAWQEAGYPVEK